MAHVEAKCDDERVVLLVRLAIAVVLGGVLSCGGQVASTATDAATAKYDATSYLDANVRFDAMSFETGVSDDSSIATADAGNDVAAADVDAADCHRDASAAHSTPQGECCITWDDCRQGLCCLVNVCESCGPQ
jgi:hypothetical protein